MLSYIADFFFLVSPSYLANIFADFFLFFRLRVVSNFGNGDCRAGEKHTRNFEETRREGASPRYFERARVCISPAPQSIAKVRDYSQSICFSLFSSSHECRCPPCGRALFFLFPTLCLSPLTVDVVDLLQVGRSDCGGRARSTCVKQNGFLSSHHAQHTQIFGARVLQSSEHRSPRYTCT